MVGPTAEERVLDILRELPEPALFLSELSARLTEVGTEDVHQTVMSLDGVSVLVVDHASPDPHLSGDLRIVALMDAGQPDRARKAAERVWAVWLREVLANHRCG